VHLVFFDESKSSDNYPHYHLGAVSIEDNHLFEVEGHVRALAEHAFGSSDLVRETEFHAAEIYHRKRHFKDWNDFGKRVALLSSFMEILSLPEVNLIDIQVNCEKLFANQEADEIAFMLLCERANDFVRSKCTLGMLIGDRESDRASERYATSLSRYRARGTNFAFGRDITNLVDSAHFTHSHLSRFLQLADVYTWLLQFQRRNRESEDDRHRAILDALKREEVNLFPAKYKEWPK